MATYKSRFKGSQIDNAVTIANANLNKGSNDTPIYYDSEGLGQAVQKDSTATVSSVKPLTSGGAYTGLEAVVDNSDVQTSTSLGTSGMPPSQNAVKQYVDNSLPAKQDTLYGGYGIDVNGATVSVSDDVFREDEEARLHADLKVDHFGDMSAGTDSEVLAVMNEAKHSTFCGYQASDASPLDPKKFIKVGSPNITDDGIASGFAGTKYLITPQKTYNTLTSMEIDADFVFTGSGFQCVYAPKNNFKSGISLVLHDASLLMRYYPTIGGSVEYISLLSLTANTQYSTKVLLQNSQIIFKYKAGIGDWVTLEPFTGITISHEDNIIEYSLGGRFTGASCDGSWLGSIDLKQFSITVDGVEAFSGNKTGIDTIKPVDFTAITSSASSPFVNPSLPFSDSGLNISADGVASGFSVSNYISLSTVQFDYSSLSVANTWKIRGKFLYTGAASAGVWAALFGQSNQNIRTYIKTDKGSAHLMLSFDGTLQNSSKCTVYGLVVNKYYIIEAEFTGTQYILSIYNNDGSLFGKNTYDSTSKIYTMSAFKMFDIDSAQTVQTDFNAFKIYVDGNLVYQPCLKIPYTYTKDGKKIVDYNYRSRVEDEYTQAGYTPYYTLSDTDYTMATVEEDDIVASLDGATSYTQRADLSIEQQGTTTSGTTVTFPKPFMDTNYALSIPYSAKTATGFTAAADGDYIAEGNVAI